MKTMPAMNLKTRLLLSIEKSETALSQVDDECCRKASSMAKKATGARNIAWCFLLFGLGCNIEVAENVRPVIVYEHSFPISQPGALLVHNFALKNNFDHTIYFTRAVTSCGCTSAEFSAKELDPGESCLVSVKLKTSAVSDDLSQHVEIYTNDPERPAFMLRLKAKVRSAVSLSERRLELRLFHYEESPPTKLLVNNFSVTTWGSINCRCSIEGIRLEPTRLAQKLDGDALETWCIEVTADINQASRRGLLVVESPTGETAECDLEVIKKIGVVAFPTSIVLDSSNGWQASTTLVFESPQLAHLSDQLVLTGEQDIQYSSQKKSANTVFVKIRAIEGSEAFAGERKTTLSFGELKISDVLDIKVYCDD